MPEHNGAARLDRIERLLETIIEEHLEFRRDLKQLLTAQVLMTESLTQLAEAQKHTDDRMNALITVVDGVIRNRPPQEPG